MNPKQKEAFEALRKKYINAIPDKIANIKKAAESKDARLLEQESHKIKGTGKTYGFEEISLVAFHVNKHFKENHPDAFLKAEKGCVLLQKIYDSILAGSTYDLQNDPLFKEIQ